MADKEHDLSQAAIVTDAPELSLDDLCAVCGVSLEHITAYAEHGVIHPEGAHQAEWRFSRKSVVQLTRAVRLERGLGLNAAGVALALDLIEQIDTLKKRLARYEAAESPSDG